MPPRDPADPHDQTVPAPAGATVSGPGVEERGPDPATAADRSVFPGYDDGGEVGRGGMAEVHRVHDRGLERDVAAKVLSGRLAHQDSLALALIKEAQITAQLEHPFIIPVHARGENRLGTPFFTMKLVDGLTLSRWMESNAPAGSENRAPQGHRLADALEVFLKVCEAVAFAHESGVLHRDIKPGNIMVGRFGQVYLMDWGLAIRIAEQKDSVVMGTPAFMSPEQARGEKLDGRSDQFSLGAVLYYLLSRRAPYAKSGLAELMALVRAGAGVDLATVPLVPPPPVDLVSIVRRAMHPNAECRFPDVSALAEAVRGFLRAGQHLPEIVFSQGDRVITEGEPGVTAFIVVEGRAEAHQVIHGVRRVVRHLGPGDVFGELAVLTGARRSASIDAVTELRVQVVSREMLESGLGMQSWVGVFVRTLATRFAELESKVRR